MSLDAILKQFQLAKKISYPSPTATQGAQHSGTASLDQLSTATRERYTRFIGSGPFACALPPIPGYMKAWTLPANIEPLGNDKHARRVRLSHGDDSDYDGDTSRADFALITDLFYNGFDRADVEVIMRATRYRPKLDELHGAETYLALTIGNALASLAAGQLTTPTLVPALSLNKGRITIPTTPPPPRDYVWQGRMVSGHAYVLGGFGGVSKSQAALQLAASVAMGIPFGSVTTKKGSALLIFGEDDLGEITRRIGAYAAHEQLSPPQRAELEKNIRTLGLIGEDTRLTVTRGGVLESNEFSDHIIVAAAELTTVSGEPIRLIVLDHAGLVHGGDFNAREDVSLTMRIINRIAHETGAAVLLLAHSPKSAGVSETSDASAVAGSTAFVDQTRGAFILATMRENEATALGIPRAMRQQFASLSVVKNNYGKTGEVSWFMRDSPPGWEVGVLHPVDLQPPAMSAAPSVATANRIKQFVATHPGQYSKTSVRDRYSGKNGPLKASKNAVAAAIDEMIANGDLILRPPTPAERNQFGMSQQIRDVLDIPANAGNPSGGGNHVARP